jgi:hypothetical protein
MQRTSEGLESILRSLQDSPEAHIRRQYRQVPLYLRHLFWEISRRYTTAAVNYLHLMNSVLTSGFSRVAFVTTNYDLFLEKALRSVAGALINGLDSYTSDPQWMLVKLHGSVDWARPIEGLPREDLMRHGSYTAAINAHPLDVFNLGDLVFQGLLSPEFQDGVMYPALTVPVQGKYEYMCPLSHIDALCEVLASCPNFLVIGSSGRDADLMELLNNKVQCRSPRLQVVSHADADRVLQRFCDSVSVFSTGYRGHYGSGFSGFLVSGGLEKFLEDLY